MTNPNLLMGTPDYLSPEQAKNSHDVDSRSDLYSLGCTLFFLLTGKPPFAHAVSLIDKLLAHTEEPPPPIRELRPDVPEPLAAVLGKMLAKKPDDRFETASDVANALVPFVRGGDELKVTGLDVIDAVAVTAPAVVNTTPVTPVPGASDRNDGPVPKGPTVADAPRPKRAKKSKRAASPWWKQRRAKIAAGVAVLLMLAVAGGRGKKNSAEPSAAPPTASATPKPEPKGPPNPWQNGGKPTEPLPFLFVVPSDGLFGPDYFPVVARMRDRGVKVVTASGQGGHATFGPPAGPKGERQTLPVDVALGDVDASQYSGIAFCGYNVQEYVGPGPRSVRDVTWPLIAAMQKQNKPVGAICLGQRVLAVHGVLSGKSAAKSKFLHDEFQSLVQRGDVRWLDDGVVVAAGKVITAGGPADVVAFADALVKAAKVP